MTAIIYDSNGRVNDFSNNYCEMAMESYYDIQQTLENMNLEAFEDYYQNEGYIEKKAVSVVVFSAMCIEAFLNDYLAVCLGDDEYYDSYDMLRPLDKIKLICQFIFKIEYDKNSLYHKYNKELFKRRNAYVHSKSQNTHDYLRTIKKKYNTSSEQLTNEEFADIIESQYNDGTLLNEEKHSYKMIIQEAEESLKAVKELGILFDTHDKGVNAIKKLFGLYYGSIDEDREIYKEPALKMLNIRGKRDEIQF